jgi:hexosaminidase
MEKVLLFGVFLLAVSQTFNSPIWPHPQKYTQTTPGKNIFLHRQNCAFQVIVQGNVITDFSQYPVLSAALGSTLTGPGRYPSRIFYDYIWQAYPMNQTFSYTPQYYAVRMTITNLGNSLDITVDESYTLTIADGDSIQITSETVWGAFRALESLSHLVIATQEKEWYYIPNTPITVTDTPRFKWRGLLIDTSRHFLPIPVIKKMIDSLEYAKFNVLHLHLVDAESFPVEMKTYNQLHEKGAWTPNLVYKQSDLKELVQYAYWRGIRVVPEFDVPGHTYSWGKGYPEILAKCPYFARNNVNNYALNPIATQKPTPLDIIQSIITEFKEIFTDTYLHLGGDELLYSCWQEDPSIVDYSTRNNLSFDQIYALFQAQLAVYMKAGKKKMVCWHELWQLNTTEYQVDKESIIQIWRNSSYFLGAIVESGYDVLLSDGWYLDMSVPANIPRANASAFRNTWRIMYLQEVENIYQFNPTTRPRVLGGEATMFGEGVDASNIESQVWPRVAAVAERLWSPQEVNSIDQAQPRLTRFRCEILRKRGVFAAAVVPDFCPYLYFDGPRPIPVDQSAFASLFVFLSTTVVFFITTVIATIVACIFWAKHKKVKKAWMADVFAGDDIVLTSNHLQEKLLQ